MKQIIEHQSSRIVTRTFSHGELSLYFLGAFGICWLCLGLIALDANHIISLGSPLLVLVLKGLGNFGPTLSAICVTALFFGVRGVRALLARSLRWRVSAYWYVIALFLPFIMVIVGVELAMLLNGAISTPSSILPLTVVSLLGVVVAPLGEELGWRGYALPRLQMRLGPIWASMALGIIWGCWHLPFFILPNSSEAVLPFVLFLVGCIAETFIYTWLFNGTGGSVIICMVFHAATNLALNTIPVFPDVQGASLLPYLLFTSVEVVTALVIFLVFRVRSKRILRLHI